MNAQFHKDFTACYTRHYYRIVKYLLGYIRSWETAEDIVQEMFVRLYEKKRRLDPESPTIKNYLFSIARNAVLDHMKHESMAAEKYSEVHFEEVSINDQFYSDVENFVIDGEVVSTLHDTMNSFPSAEQKILMERLYDNRRRSRVCADNKISYYRVRMIEENFIDELRQKLQPYFAR